MFVFGDFNVHHKVWLTYSGGTNRPSELCCILSISNDLTQIVFTRIPDCDSHSPVLLDSHSPPVGNSDHVIVSVSIDFQIKSKQDAPFHRVAYDYSRADWDGLRDHLRDVPWQDIFKLVLLLLYHKYRKYQVKPHSSPWFLVACATAIVYRNRFFRLYRQNKFSESKVKFRQASNRFKRVLEAAKLTYTTKIKESITSQKLDCWEF